MARSACDLGMKNLIELQSALEELRSETSQRQFSSLRDNREKPWLKITPMNFSDSPPTMFTHDGLSRLEISTSEYVGTHIKQSTLVWSCEVLDLEPEVYSVECQQKSEKSFFAAKFCPCV